MEQIRILLVDMPRLVREMIDAAISAEHDMCVVGTAEDRAEVASAARAVHPNFVIVGLDGDALPDCCLELLEEQPRLKLLGIEAAAGSAHLWELRPERRPLGEISPAEVVDVIRGAVAPSRG